MSWLIRLVTRQRSILTTLQAGHPQHGQHEQQTHDAQTVTYSTDRRWWKGADRTLQYGLIAEEVEKVYPEMVQHTADGQVLRFATRCSNSMLLMKSRATASDSVQQLQLQTQTQKNAAQEQKITTQEQQIIDLEKRLRRIEAAVTDDPKPGAAGHIKKQLKTEQQTLPPKMKGLHSIV